jgi:hypothetical protein
VEQETSQANLPAIQATGLLGQQSAGQTLAMLKGLPTSLSDHQFAQVKAIAKAPLPYPKAASDENFGKAVVFLETSLKRRKGEADDDGELRMRAYRKCLSHLSHPELWWTVEQAIIRLTFFPTVKELLDIAKGWERRDEATEAQRLAKLLVNREVNRRLREQNRKAPAPPITEESIAAMSPELRSMGLKLGYLIEVDGKVIPAPETEGTEA